MNEIVKPDSLIMAEAQSLTETFFGGCPHDCPDTCSMLFEVEDGQLPGRARQPGPPDDARRSLREAEGLREAPLPPGPPALSDEAGRPEGLEAVRAHHLGRGARHHRHALEGDHRPVRSAGDRALQLSRQSGPGARAERRRRLLQPHGRDRDRADLLRRGLLHGLAAHRRPDRRPRPRELHPLQVHRDLGLQLGQHEPAPLGHRQGRAEEGRQGRRDRRLRLAHRQGGRLAHRPEARHRRRARHGADQLDHRAGARRPGLCRQLHGRLRGAEGAGRSPHARMGRRDHRRAGGRHPHARPRTRDRAARRDPHGRGARAPLRRRPDHPRRVLHPGADRRVAPCRRRRHAVRRVGAPLQVRRDVPARPDPGGHPRRLEPADRPRADRRDAARSADHVDDVLELEPRHPGARDRQDRRRPDARGPVHGLGRALHLRHRLLRRHPAAGDHGRRDGGHDPLLGPPLPDLQHQMRGQPPARRSRTTRSSAGSRPGSASRKRTSSGPTASAWSTTSTGTPRPARASTSHTCASTASRA